MRNGVTFWTEGGSSTGMGHVERSLNIAREAARTGLKVRFLVNDDRVVSRSIKSAGFESDFTGPGFLSDKGRLSETGLVVIDSRGDLSGRVARLKESGKKVVVIDNTTASVDADAVVIPSVFFKNDPRSVPQDKLYTGPEYLVIGPGFIEEKRSGQESSYGRPLKVLVTMGGADPFNLTEMVVRSLEHMEGIETTVVLGPAFDPPASLLEFIERKPRAFRFTGPVGDMAPLMASSHLAFTAVGTTIYELAYMGVPSVVIGNYESDKIELAEIDALGIGRGLGFRREVTPLSIYGAVRRYQADMGSWARTAGAAAGLTDGGGARRIARVLESLTENRAGYAADRLEVRDAQG